MKNLYIALSFLLIGLSSIYAGNGKKLITNGSQAHILVEELVEALYAQCVSEEVRAAIEGIKHDKYCSDYKNIITHKIIVAVYSAIKAQNCSNLADAVKNMESGSPGLADFLSFHSFPLKPDGLLSPKRTLKENLKGSSELYEIKAKIREIGKKTEWSKGRIKQEVEYIFNQMVALIDDYCCHGLPRLIDEANKRRKEIDTLKNRAEELDWQVAKEKQENSAKEDEKAHLNEELTFVTERYEQQYNSLSTLSKYWFSFRGKL